jgi:hypothetical protein
MNTYANSTGSPDVPELKPWMERVFRGAGMNVPPSGRAREELGRMGIEMVRFLGFCRELEPGTELVDALKGYGRYLRSNDPPLEGARIDRAREALRVFRQGVDGWHLIRAENGSVEVKFRAKARPEPAGEESRPEVDCEPRPSSGAGYEPGPGRVPTLDRNPARSARPDEDRGSSRGSESGGHRGWNEVEHSWDRWRQPFARVLAVRRYARRTADA